MCNGLPGFMRVYVCNIPQKSDVWSIEGNLTGRGGAVLSALTLYNLGVVRTREGSNWIFHKNTESQTSVGHEIYYIRIFSCKSVPNLAYFPPLIDRDCI